MASVDDESPSHEIVFAVEATSNMITHWEGIKKNYISPIIQHFHKSSAVGNELLTSSFKNLYGLVLFYTADRSPDLLTECFLPLGDRWQFFKLLESIEFIGGGAEHHSYIAEGLATVAQLFDDMRSQQNNRRVEKFCFVICNTPPYELPTLESFAYSGKTHEELTEVLKDRGVKLSVICPHLIKELKLMYMLANDNPTPIMNYAQDKRHLVLLSGLHLSLEKEPKPLSDNATNDVITVKSEIDLPIEEMQTSEEVIVPSVSDNIVVKTEFSTVPQPVQQPPQGPTVSTDLFTNTANVTASNTPASLSQNQVISSQSSYINTSQPIVIKSEIPAATENKPSGINVNVSTRPAVSSGSSFAPSQISSSSQNPEKLTNARKEAQKVLVMVSNQQVAPTYNFPPLEVNHRVIWTGAMEWTEKRRTSPGNFTQSIPCQISQSITSNVRDGMNWSPKLSTQLMSQHVISQSPPLCNILKASKQVTIYFPAPQMAQMVNLFVRKTLYGLVQQLAPNDDKLLVFFLKKKEDKSSFVGLLPHDSSGFMTLLRSSAAQRMQLQQQQQQQRPNIAVASQNVDNNVQSMGQPTLHQTTSMVTEQTVNPSMSQFQGNQSHHSFSMQTLPNQQQQSNQQQMPQRINQQVNQGMTNMATIRVPISQPHPNIRTQPGQPMMPSQLPDSVKVINNMQGRNVASNDMSGQLRGNQPNVHGNIGGQRVISGGMSMPGNTRTPMMRMPQMSNVGGNMTGNRPMSQGNSQLRSLLGPGNNTMQTNTMNIRQQDNSGLRPTNHNNMQQQNFIRGMPGMQNQRNF